MSRELQDMAAGLAGLEKMFISLQAGQNFPSAGEISLQCGMVSLKYFFIFPLQITKFPGKELPAQPQGRIQPVERGAKLLTDNGGSRGLAPWRGPGGQSPLAGLQGGSAPLRREILNF